MNHLPAARRTESRPMETLILLLIGWALITYLTKNTAESTLVLKTVAKSLLRGVVIMIAFVIFATIVTNLSGPSLEIRQRDHIRDCVDRVADDRLPDYDELTQIATRCATEARENVK